MNLNAMTHGATYELSHGRKIHFARTEDGSFFCGTQWGPSMHYIALTAEAADLLCSALLVSRDASKKLPAMILPDVGAPPQFVPKPSLPPPVPKAEKSP